MGITGPIIPKQYSPSSDEAPKPDVTDAFAGEIITCTKTGRMWVKWLSAHTEEMIPIRPEFETSNMFGSTKAGVDRYLNNPGNPVLEAVGLKLYSSLPINLYTNNTGTTGQDVNCGGITATGLTMANLNYTFGYVGGDTRLSAAKPVFTTYGFTPADGSSPIMWYALNITGSQAEWGYQPQTSTGVWGGWQAIAYFTPSKCDFRKTVEANSGVKIPGLTSQYLLNTDSNGLVQGSSLTSAQTVLSSTVTLTSNVATTLAGITSAPSTGGTFLVTVQVMAYHNGNYNWSMTLRDHVAGVSISSAKADGSGYTTLTMTAIYTSASAPSFRVAAFSAAHTPTIQIAVGEGTYPTDNSTTHLSWVRLA
jgi:hypothetical protein